MPDARPDILCTALARPILVAVLCLPALSAQDGAALSSARLHERAATIDALIEQDLAAHGQQPNPRSDDATFVRRAYLQIVGRVPTVDQARAFLDSADRRRRDRLIDELLESPGRTSAEIHVWADLFRARSRLQNRVSGEPFLDFLRRCIEDGVPYDEMVRAMVAAEGPAHTRGNGATGYLLRDLGMPEDSMANTIRIFLGTRMECAQCHDHPFDRWKQREFFEMAAFSGGLRYRDDALLRSEQAREVAALGRELRQRPNGADLNRALRLMFRPVAAGLSGSGTGVARLPEDYAGGDLEPRAFVVADTIFGDQLAMAEPRPLRSARARRGRSNRRRPTHADIGSRAVFADWLTSPQNPRFTMVITNRMWKRAFGVGLIEPVDDIRADTEASNPELLAFLEQVMLDVDYDLREFQRVLYHTEAWQRCASVAEPASDSPYRFQGPALRRLSAEQLWDSLLALTIDDIDATVRPTGSRAEPVYARYDELTSLTGDELRERLDREALRFEDPKAYRRMVAAERARMRSDMEGSADRARTDLVRELTAEMRAARKKGDTGRVRELAGELRELRRPSTRRAFRGLVRASELPSPAPAGHFLREFGQSDREQIDGAFDDANVPQALSLMNGLVERQVLDRRSALSRRLASIQSVEDAVDLAFLAILTREPSGEEAATWRAILAKDRAAGTRDLVWTLCNTHEFRFLQ